MKENNTNTDTRGVLAIINKKGYVEYKPIGEVSQTEFLGIGADIIMSHLRDGLSSCLRNQLLTNEALKEVTGVLMRMSKEMIGEEKCTKDYALDSLPLEDSGSSTENSQESLDE